MSKLDDLRKLREAKLGKKFVRKSSGGDGESGPIRKTGGNVLIRPMRPAQLVGVASNPPETKPDERGCRNISPSVTVGRAKVDPPLLNPKVGRPRIGEKREKPWEFCIPPMSERTWYRRQAEMKTNSNNKEVQNNKYKS